MPTLPGFMTDCVDAALLALAIGLARHLRRDDALVREGHFEGWRPQLFGTGLSGSTVAVIGLGKASRVGIAEHHLHGEVAGALGL